MFHAYIIEGDEKNRAERAEQIIKSSDVMPEDIYRVKPDGLSIKDSAIFDLQYQIRKKPFVGSHNVAIIDEAEKMTTRAQNRLLKTLEEPPGNAVLILLVSNVQNLLQTVRSRCILLKAGYEHDENIMSEKADIIGKKLLNGTNYYDLMADIEDIGQDKKTAEDFLKAFEFWLGQAALKNQSKSRQLYDACLGIAGAVRDLNLNVNPKLALKSFLLEYVVTRKG